jgi:hypothetical protein
MSDEEYVALMARIQVLEDRLADVDAILAVTLSGEDVNVDPLEAAFLRNRERANKARGG